MKHTTAFTVLCYIHLPSIDVDYGTIWATVKAQNAQSITVDGRFGAGSTWQFLLPFFPNHQGPLSFGKRCKWSWGTIAHFCFYSETIFTSHSKHQKKNGMIAADFSSKPFQDICEKSENHEASLHSVLLSRFLSWKDFQQRTVRALSQLGQPLWKEPDSLCATALCKFPYIPIIMAHPESLIQCAQDQQYVGLFFPRILNFLHKTIAWVEPIQIQNSLILCAPYIQHEDNFMFLKKSGHEIYSVECIKCGIFHRV